MINFDSDIKYSFGDLLKIMNILRGENGCPWDIAQNHKSIRQNFIEEVYEVCDAIDNDDTDNLCEELGDVLLQVVFHSHISNGNGGFCIDDVINGICKKLVHRHPHIFSDAIANDAEAVLKSWDDIKKVEKGNLSYTDEMEKVPKCLPALMYAHKIQKKAKKSGFDWPDVSGAFDKIYEETQELSEAVEQNSNIHEELGDLLFAVVNVARFVGVDSEKALYDATQKFRRRFAYIEQQAGDKMSSISLAEMDKLWNDYKKKSK